MQQKLIELCLKSESRVEIWHLSPVKSLSKCPLCTSVSLSVTGSGNTYFLSGQEALIVGMGFPHYRLQELLALDASLDLEA
jgi:hypothetical protein